ncbi:MAG: septum formation protein Maf [Bacteroidetes bacterium]|jgi:septum formation protein|nr:septum formation protein Maf [Bacteroidota bacterium]MBT5529940.1 septum formation protein Maf [Cytophagia bacterium]MBT3422167.1 septum formation protein Maf [Bacteroidota bacterium]MBT3801159.1 septum formation protein Maf [Bacteroidota bacterium]MBT3933409.1 septum formation protein Maf [Bacteroidota bacterium]
MILVSQSPRRQEILTKAGYTFEVLPAHIDENYPDNMSIEEIPVFLAEQKAMSLSAAYENEILLAADTIVVLDEQVINKPADAKEAFEMLSLLSGKTHQVISGVCIAKGEDVITFSDISLVTFRELTEDEILYYIEHHKPYDKAGAYGVQDFIGMVGIERIEGSFYNVMGLPIHKVYKALNMLQVKDKE